MKKLLQQSNRDFSGTYDLYGRLLFKISMIYLGNKDDAEEAMQEAFYRLLHKSPQFYDAEHEKAWLIRTTVNFCKDILRSAWHKRVEKMEDIEKYYDSPQDLDIIREILKLPVKYKTVIHLYYFEDYSVKQIAEILNLKESAVKMRLQRGRQLLKIELEGEEE
ncbi:MAG: RNA polymerase subunit sigma-24 [Gracilibacter sp. BRH_c7a]|nr:MAG: RNA polymerase subunit sigma-24 [Gracilibacter sp. BRH_c7a]